METSRRKVGGAFLAVAGVWIGYIVIAFTLASGFEKALVDSAEALGVPDNRLPADEIARIYDAHMLGSLVGMPVLVFAPVVLLYAMAAVRRLAPGTKATWAFWHAVISAAIWWFYLVINLGAYGTPGHLPPLTAQLDVLTVPLVAAMSLFALLAVIASAGALHESGALRRSARIAQVLSWLLLVSGVAGTILSDFADPLPPVALLPPALVLGVAMLRRSRRTADRDLSVAGAMREH